MSRDEQFWPVLAVIGALVTMYVIYALVTGKVRAKGPIPLVLQSEYPVNYWLGIGVYSFAALMCWYLVAKALLDRAAEQ